MNSTDNKPPEPLRPQPKMVQFNSESMSTDSDDLLNPPQLKNDAQDYYDDVYFDSDEDSDGERNDVAVRSGSEGPAGGSSILDITEGLSKSHLGSGSRPTKNKKRPTISDADLLYDPEEDDRDENWLIKKIAANRPPGCKPEDIWTDAVLSCPMCLTHLCFDCQQHEFYPHQFRAMFVESCKVIENEILRFPKESKKGKNPGSSSKSTSNSSAAAISGGAKHAEDTTGAVVPEFKPSADDEADAIYHPVVCEVCNSKVALIDQDEVYHFFNVIPSSI